MFKVFITNISRSTPLRRRLKSLLMLDLFSGEFTWTGSLNKKILFGNDYHDNDYYDNVLTYSCQAPRIATSGQKTLFLA